MSTKTLIGFFLLICFTSSAHCGGDYSAMFQESFYTMISLPSKEPRFQLGKTSRGMNSLSVPSDAKHPPFCNGNGNFVSGVNEIGSCVNSCPEGYEKHFFIEILDGEEVEFCCCGECS